MASLATLRRSARVNASLSWLGVVALVGATVPSVARGDPLWAGFAVLAAVVVAAPALGRRAWTAMVRWEFVAAVTVAVVARAFGALVSPAGYVATAGLATIVAVQLDAFTEVEMTPRFGVLFVTVATAAFAGVWSVVEFTADTVLGTTFLADTAELMWDLVLATAVGIVAGLCLDLYLRLRGTPRTGQPATRTGGRRRASRVPFRQSSLRYLVYAMQVGLVAITVFAVVRRNVTLVVNAGVPLGLSLSPFVVRRRYGQDIGAGLAVWIALAAFLHAIGAVGLYELFGWYDQLTHTVSASLVAGAGYAAVAAIERHSRAVDFPARFRILLVVLVVLAIGVAWEILEFASGGLAALVGGEALLAQYGMRDVVLDLVFDGVGALVVAVWGSQYFDGIADTLARRLRLVSGE